MGASPYEFELWQKAQLEYKRAKEQEVFHSRFRSLATPTPITGVNPARRRLRNFPMPPL